VRLETNKKLSKSKSAQFVCWANVLLCIFIQL